MKEKLTGLREEIYKFTVIGGYDNITLSMVDKINRKSQLFRRNKHHQPIGSNGCFYNTPFNNSRIEMFSKEHGTFIKTGHILGVKNNFKNVKN